MIELRDVTFAYPHGRRVFEGFSFSVARGERVALTGPNGAGKSTLMHLVMGLLKPESGTVRVLGRERRREEDFLEVRRRVGLLFQDSEDQLFCPTVEEDLAFGPLNLGHSHAEAREIVRETARALGIEGLLGTLTHRGALTHRLSGGEKRLAALASVLTMRPSCLLLDEPTAGLDGERTARVLAYLREHAETVVVASHDHAFLEALTTRAVHVGGQGPRPHHHR